MQPPATDSAEEQASRLDTTSGGSGDGERQVGDAGDGEPINVDPADPSPEKGSPPSRTIPSSDRTLYTWQDGDHTRQVWHETAAGDNQGSRVPGSSADGAGLVFYSEAGARMTLPGGVLLALDPEWDQARIDQFFADNGIAQSLVQDRTFATNAFFIETVPGLPSLNLANQLAGQQGVLISSPNWRTEAVTR